MGGYEAEGTVEVRAGESITQAIQRLLDDERTENGIGGYSGTLAEKHAVRVVGTWGGPRVSNALPTKEQLRGVIEAIQGFGEYGFEQPAPTGSKPCGTCHGRTIVNVNEEVVAVSDGAHFKASIPRPCAACHGVGTVPKSAEELNADTARAIVVAQGLLGFDLDERKMKAAADMYHDKWGSAIALVYGSHVWVGGVCSS